MNESRKDNLVYVDDMLGAIEKIKRYSRRVTKEGFLKKEMLVDAEEGCALPTPLITCFLACSLNQGKIVWHKSVCMFK